MLGSKRLAMTAGIAVLTGIVGLSFVMAGAALPEGPAALVDFMIGCGSLAAQTEESIRTLDHNHARHGAAELIGYLRAGANLPGLVRAVRTARRHAHELGWTISHPMSVSTLAGLPISVGVDEVRDLVFQAQRAANETAVPVRSASTIHKAKGREFDHVVSRERFDHRARVDHEVQRAARGV